MTKADKIKEAWISEIGEEKYKYIESQIDGDGFYNGDDEILSDEVFNSTFVVNKKTGKACNRPKSLAKLGSNNGWNRIDEVGLPSADIEFVWLQTEEGIYHAEPKLLHDKDIKDYWLKTATHWQELKKPQPPLY